MRISDWSSDVCSSDLLEPEQLAAASQFQILLGDHEAVVGLAHPRQPLARGFGEILRAQQEAYRLRRAAPDAAAALVELRQPEILGMFDDHPAGGGHVDPDQIGNASGKERGGSSVMN